MAPPRRHEREAFSKQALPFTLGAFLLLAFVQRDSTCLKISSIEVPAAAWNGSQVTLACNYELAPDDQLYSVKWYKNYVEFYRFQPPQAQDVAAQQVGQNLNLNQQQQQQQASGARHEFELEGINLDMTKSNATHVQLRQVNLSSEATFKCEVSADSPTFATVSAERQMKIFVLPKQKLALVDNSNVAGGPSGQQTIQQPGGQVKPLKGRGIGEFQNNEPAQVRVQNNNNKQQIYQLNELLNFTCIAGASRPGARLSWLLNDEPLGELTPTLIGSSNNNNKSKALQAMDISGEQRTLPNDLIEVRSTLTLRLEASHMKLLRKQAINLNHQRNSNQPGGAVGGGGHLTSILPVKLSCLARLSVSFSSETSVLVANGQPANSIKRRGHNQPPAAASWIRGDDGDDQGTTTLGDLFALGGHSRRRNNNNLLAGDDDLRWAGGEHEAAALREQRFRSFEGAGLADAWHLQDAGSVAASGEESPVAAQGNGKPRNARLRNHNNIVWTQRQLRAQADHIHQLVRRWRPNDLETPHIEAKPVTSSRPIFTTTTTSANNPDATTPESGPPDEEPDEELVEEARRTAASSPSLIIPGDQSPFSSGGGEGDDRSLEVPAGGKNDNLRNSYKLDELVNFTCHLDNPQEKRALRATNPLYSVQVKWFINNQEISPSTRVVNAFDGQRFYHSQAADTTIKPPEAFQFSSMAKQPNWLLIGFSATLLQLKELTLKCRTIVEQPLIEYENGQVISLATSPFIQANQPQQDQRRPSTSFNLRPASQASNTGGGGRLQSSVGLNGFDYNNQQPNGRERHRNNVILMRQSQQARSDAARSIKTTTSYLHLMLPLLLVAYSCFLVTIDDHAL